jgi:uncharacterized protein (DUF697 family)
LNPIKLLGTGVKAVRPVADAVRSAEQQSEEGGHLAILPGDPAATRRLRELLGAPSAAPDEDALAILAATPGLDLSAGAAALERARRRHPEGALAVLIGRRSEREELERRLLEGHTLEPSNIAHTPSLEGPGAQAVIDRVIDMLGDGAIAAGRRNPGLRPAIGKRVVRGAARQAAGIGALPLAGADMPILALVQVKMVAQLSALYDRPFGAERALEALAIVGAGFGWRAVGRSAVGLVPVAGWAVQGALSYAVTRGVGEAALARLTAGHDLVGGPAIDAVKPHIERVLSKLPGRS